MVTPIRNNVLVKPYPSDEISIGGIYIPETARGVSNKVKVIATGKGTKKRPMKRSDGETGYRVKDYGIEIDIGGELHFLMDMDGILALSD